MVLLCPYSHLTVSKQQLFDHLDAAITPPFGHLSTLELGYQQIARPFDFWRTPILSVPFLLQKIVEIVFTLLS